MKRLKFLAATIAAATLLVSCSKDDAEAPPATGEAAKLRVSFVNSSSNGTKMRSLDETKETTISKVTLFVLSLDKSILKVDCFALNDNNEGEFEIDLEVTTAANHVVAIANTDLSESTSKTLDELKKEVTELGDLDPENNGFYASGITQSKLDFERDADGKMFANAEIVMKLLPARLDVTVTNSMSNSDVGQLTLDNVAVLYSAAYSQWVAATDNGTDFYPAADNVNINDGYYRSGFTGWDSEIENQNSVNHNLIKKWDEPISNDFKETFYVYPTPPSGGEYKKHTILAVCATLDGQSRYFPIHFNNKDQDELESGKKYIVRITLQGDANAGGGSVDDPEQEIVTGNIHVTVSIANWEEKGNIDKEFP